MSSFLLEHRIACLERKAKVNLLNCKHKLYFFIRWRIFIIINNVLKSIIVPFYITINNLEVFCKVKKKEKKAKLWKTTVWFCQKNKIKLSFNSYIYRDSKSTKINQKGKAWIWRTLKIESVLFWKILCFYNL